MATIYTTPFLVNFVHVEVCPHAQAWRPRTPCKGAWKSNFGLAAGWEEKTRRATRARHGARAASEAKDIILCIAHSMQSRVTSLL